MSTTARIEFKDMTKQIVFEYDGDPVSILETLKDAIGKNKYEIFAILVEDADWITDDPYSVSENYAYLIDEVGDDYLIVKINTTWEEIVDDMISRYDIDVCDYDDPDEYYSCINSLDKIETDTFRVEKLEESEDGIITVKLTRI